MTEDEIKIECLKLAASLTQKPPEVIDLAKKLWEFVMGLLDKPAAP